MHKIYFCYMPKYFLLPYPLDICSEYGGVGDTEYGGVGGAGGGAGGGGPGFKMPMMPFGAAAQEKPKPSLTDMMKAPSKVVMLKVN